MCLLQNRILLTSISECTNTFVSNVATVIISVKETVNTGFNYIIYGTSTGIDGSDTGTGTGSSDSTD